MKKIIFGALCLVSSFGFSQEKLKVGIIKYKTKEKVNETFPPLIKYVADQLGRDVQLEIVPEDELGFHLNNGAFDIGIFTVFPYLKAKTNFPDIHVFATHQVAEKDHFFGSILVAKDSEINDLNGLEGKKFLFVKPTSTSGYKYPKGIFTELNLDLESGFMDYDFSGGHEEAILALKEGRVDGIAVDEGRFDKVEGVEKSDFKELERYKVPYHAYVFAPKIEADLRNEILDVFSNAHKDPSTKNLFDNALGIEQWLPVQDEYYNLIRRYLRITRVKPSVEFQISTTDAASAQLGELGDITTVMEGKIRRLLNESDRYAKVTSADPEYRGEIIIASTSDHFSFQIKVNDELLTDGVAEGDSLEVAVPAAFADALLGHSHIETNLIYNGTDWFITYGRNDGLDLENYTYEIIDKEGRSLNIARDEIKRIDNMNIVFEPNDMFERNAAVTIKYRNKESQNETAEEEENLNIFSRGFWKSDSWDKIGIILGGLFAVLSGIIGKVIADRRKKRFKNILYETNELIKEYVGGHIKMEAKLIEQKERVSHALEEGHINENQFLILKHRMEDLQNFIDFQRKGEVDLTEEDSDEIQHIVKDGKVTERDFSRIMNILNKKVGR